MSTDRQIGKKLPQWVRREDTPGIRLDAGPYIGVIKNNLDPARSGRLQVYIPDLGGEENDPKTWRTVSYASPFFGSTYQVLKNQENDFDKTEHTYGMWFVPPDINNEVLVTFVAGDPMRGYWFACISSTLSHFMVPGIASTKTLSTNNIGDPSVKAALGNNTVFPAAEFNTQNPTLASAPTYLKNSRPIHEEQAKVLINQGLDRDNVRGAISSSSQREVPSSVFGISTPGRPIAKYDTAEKYTEYADKLNKGTLTAKDFEIPTRRGGHQFVMDDGDAAGNDQLIRLRTASGHQILMNDKERIMYISNSEGSVWIELAGSGHLHIYSSAGVNIRTQGDFNLHSDKNINLNAAGSINIAAKNAIAVESNTASINARGQFTAYAANIGIGSSGPVKLSAAGTASFSAGGPLNFVGAPINLNSTAAETVSEPAKIKVYSLSDTGQDPTSKIWVSQNGRLSSIVPIAPTHEPWPRQAGTKGAAPATQPPAPAATATAPAATAPSAAPTTPSAAPGATTPTAPATSTPATPAPPVKDPCTMSPAPATNPNSINAGAAPNFMISSADCNFPPGATLDSGFAKAQKKPVKNPAPKDLMTNKRIPDAPGGIGKLTPHQVKAIMVQMGWQEGGLKYTARNEYNYIGKYQFGAAALVDRGYIKPDYQKTYRNRAVTLAAAWRGTDGVRSMDDWFNNPGVQEKVMYENMVANYKELIRRHALKAEESPCVIAGMLCVAHLLGVGGAKTWRTLGIGADANDTTGEVYFNMGRYAVDVLAK